MLKIGSEDQYADWQSCHLTEIVSTGWNHLFWSNLSTHDLQDKWINQQQRSLNFSVLFGDGAARTSFRTRRNSELIFQMLVAVWSWSHHQKTQARFSEQEHEAASQNPIWCVINFCICYARFSIQHQRLFWHEYAKLPQHSKSQPKHPFSIYSIYGWKKCSNYRLIHLLETVVITKNVEEPASFWQ